MSRAQHSPARIVPQRGQVPENSAKPPNSEHWRVLHEHVSRSYLTHDAGHFSPEPRPFSFDAGSLSGTGDVLARESARDDIHESSPGSPVEGLDIVPDWEEGEQSIPLSLEEDLLAVGLKLNGTDGAPSEELASENPSTSPGK